VDPPEFREKGLIDDLQEYWLNLVFPAERTIPAIAFISQVMNNGVANYSFYWSDEQKYYSDMNKINSVLQYDAKIWCSYFTGNCTETQNWSYFELLKGLNWMEFDPNKIIVEELDSKIGQVAEEIIKR